MVPTVLAHVKWYVEDAQHATLDTGFALRPSALGLLAGAVVAAGLWRLAARRWLGAPELRMLQGLGRLAPWVPRLLALHLGVSLLSLAVADAYLAPNLSLAGVRGGWLLALGQGLVGVWLISGVRPRPAALAVVALGPLGVVLDGPVPVLEAVDVLGMAAFLALLPPGRDRYGARDVGRDELFVPLLLLRLGVGVSLIVLAFTEKLLVPQLARELLDARPWLDPLQQLGLTSGPDTFIQVASAVEVLIGLLVISGAAPQLAVLVAAVPFNVTLVFFDRYELIGHLPVYGALLALLVYGSHPQLAPTVARLARAPGRDWRRRVGDTGRSRG
ncbi:MAG: DoxX family membrane protein [Actinobacteria bacterium]|jgi:hypothetical protein|nr:DoxX family membrane protein [Actinomycetota bacterium]